MGSKRHTVLMGGVSICQPPNADMIQAKLRQFKGPQFACTWPTFHEAQKMALWLAAHFPSQSVSVEAGECPASNPSPKVTRILLVGQGWETNADHCAGCGGEEHEGDVGQISPYLVLKEVGAVVLQNGRGEVSCTGFAQENLCAACAELYVNRPLPWRVS